MEPKIITTKDKIYICGHYADKVKCAKLTLLANMFGDKVSAGYVEFANTSDICNALTLIDGNLLFACDTGDECSGGCWSYGCGSGCGDSCSVCSASCGPCSGCGGSCSTNCSGGCSGDCWGVCRNSCSGSCESSCTGSCVGKCTDSCNNGCSGTEATTIYNYLKQRLIDLANDPIILEKDFTNLEQLIKNEAKRRSVESKCNPQEAIGKLVEATSVNLIIDDYTVLNKVFSSKAIGDKTLINDLKAYIIAGCELYETCIPGK